LGLLWTNAPQLKKCFKDTEDAFRIFSSELERNLTELRKDGLFFTFSSDPMLPEARPLTLRCVDWALDKGVPVQILTKRAEFAHDIRWAQLEAEKRKKIAFGFTLTGCDDLEPGASSNQERMEAMRTLHDWGYRTFASIEPVVNPKASMECIRQTADSCDLFKVGLMSGKKDYVYKDIALMLNEIKDFQTRHACRFYLKDSFVNFLKTNRKTLGIGFVDMDYNIFNEI
jgi:DNA repair photolyase